jgi:hypothetical protein
MAVLFHNQHDLGATLGPFYVPGYSACYECFNRRRLAALSPWETTVLEAAGTNSEPVPLLLAADWVVIELTKRLTGIGTPIGYNRVLYLDYFNGIPEVHGISRVPRCTVCGPYLLPDRQIWLDEDNPFRRREDHG